MSIIKVIKRIFKLENFHKTIVQDVCQEYLNDFYFYFKKYDTSLKQESRVIDTYIMNLRG